MKWPDRAQLAPLWLALAAVSISGAFLWHHLSSPSDGARLEPGEPVWRTDGVVVTPLELQPGGLHPGDVVVAVDGQSMESWAHSLFQPDMPRPGWSVGQTVTYRVLRAGHEQDVTITLRPYPIGAILAKGWSLILSVALTQFVMTFIFLRRSDERAVRILFVIAWSLSHTYNWLQGLQVMDLVGGAGFWLFKLGADVLWHVFWGAGLAFALVFPRDHPLVLKRRQIIPITFLAPFVLYSIYLVVTRPLAASTLDWLGQWAVGDWVVAIIFLALTVVIIPHSYWSSPDLAARRKIRWLVYGSLMCGVGALVFWFLPGVILGRPFISASALGLLLLPFPFSVAIAVMRYQLFDIDLLIRRTLIYSMLTASLAFVYFSSVVLLQQFFRAVTGAQQSEIVTVISTLAIAALFVPLRQRVQAFIDQRFYRRKYDAARTLAAFAATMRDETDLEKLTERLVSVVEETMQPESVSVWLKPTKNNQPRMEGYE